VGRLSDILKTELFPTFSKKLSSLGMGKRVRSFGLLRMPRSFYRGTIGWVRHRFVRRYSDQSVVLNQLLTLVRANAPLAEGIVVASRDAPAGEVRACLLDLAERLKAGLPLSEAFERTRLLNAPYQVAMIEASDKSGQLERGLEDLIDDAHRAQRRGADYCPVFYYVALLSLVQLSIISFITVRIFPIFEEMRGDFGAGTPPSYGLPFVGDILEFARTRGDTIVSFLGFACVFMVALRFIAPLRSFVLALLMQLPYLRVMGQKTQSQRIASVLEKLFAGGYQPHEALSYMATFDFPRSYRKAMIRMADCTESGVSMTEAFSRERRLFRPAFRTFLRFGEYSGELSGACKRLSDLYAREVEVMHKFLVSALIPIYVGVFGTITMAFTLYVFTITISVGEFIMESM
jgi:type II secretory pathway component PulF